MCVSDYAATHHWHSPSADKSRQSRLEKQPSTLLIGVQNLQLLFLLAYVLCVLASPAQSMVMAAVRSPFSPNPTGLVPQLNGTPVSVSEIGFTPGKEASSVRAFDDVDGHKGYSGLYLFGASYNPGKFTSPTSATAVRQLPLVLDGEPGALAPRSERGERVGRDVCIRPESSERQPQQHTAHYGTALQRAAAPAHSQYDIVGLRAKQPKLAVFFAGHACVED
jgi:hypothetical protein